jgi:uncharacterized membrane protein YkvA (DUF1232 family)
LNPTDPLDRSRALVPEVIQVNETRVRKGFLPKLRRVAASIPFASDAVSVYFCARDPATPATAKGMMLAALAYFELPSDAIPDILAGVGFTDDAAVLAAVVGLLGRHIKPHHRKNARDLLQKIADED